jgi:hypothetical protein
VYGVCIPMCVVYVWCVYIYPCKFMFVHMVSVSCVYNIVCRYTSVNLCFSLCVFVYAILACVRWFLYWICDVCICVYMMWKYVCICMAFRVQVPTFTKFCFPSQELVTQEVKVHWNEDSNLNMMNVCVHL